MSCLLFPYINLDTGIPGRSLLHLFDGNIITAPSMVPPTFLPLLRHGCVRSPCTRLSPEKKGIILRVNGRWRAWLEHHDPQDRSCMIKHRLKSSSASSGNGEHTHLHSTSTSTTRSYCIITGPTSSRSPASIYSPELSCSVPCRQHSRLAYPASPLETEEI